MFEDILELGYGKPVCSFLNSKDATNLLTATKHSALVVQGHAKRWGFQEPVWNKTQEDTVIIKTPWRTTHIEFPVYYADFKKQGGRYSIILYSEIPPFNHLDTYWGDRAMIVCKNEQEFNLLKDTLSDFQKTAYGL